MKVLQIIENAYRATIEEQDDPIVWLSHCLNKAGAEVTVLLTGNAVCYALEGQDASGLLFGAWRQTHPPRVDVDLSTLIAQGTAVYAVAEDLERRGLLGAPRIPGVEAISRAELPRLCETHDGVWHW